MNARDILHYGHKHVLDSLKDFPDDAWTIAEVTTEWSARDVLSHLASYECYLEDVLTEVLDPSAETPTLDRIRTAREVFNAGEVESRRAVPGPEVLDEYQSTHDRVMKLIDRFTPERLRENGTLPWYGEGYSLDDFIVYTNYAHKREHSAQIRMFRKKRGL